MWLGIQKSGRVTTWRTWDEIRGKKEKRKRQEMRRRKDEKERKRRRSFFRREFVPLLFFRIAIRAKKKTKRRETETDARIRSRREISPPAREPVS